MNERYAVYILASRRTGTLYIGVTNDLLRRIEQHKALAVPGFTRKYRVTTLVYAERYADIHEAIAREKQLKGWTGHGSSSSSRHPTRIGSTSTRPPVEARLWIPFPRLRLAGDDTGCRACRCETRGLCRSPTLVR